MSKRKTPIWDTSNRQSREKKWRRFQEMTNRSFPDETVDDVIRIMRELNYMRPDSLGPTKQALRRKLARYRHAKRPDGTIYEECVWNTVRYRSDARNLRRLKRKQDVKRIDPPTYEA